MALAFEQRPAGLAGNPKEEASMTTMEEKRPALPFERQARESQRAFGAFSLYLSLGPDRSLSAVGAKLGKGKRQMEKWSRRWSWAERVTAYSAHMAELERRAIERVAVEKAVEWWQLQEPTRRQAWLEAELAIAMVRKARERWEKSGRTPGFEGMARMLELAFKLKQFAAGMPSEIKETHTLVTGKVSVEWEAAIRKAYGVVDVEEVQRTEVGDQRSEAAGNGVPALPEVKR
jgi:hypothetical protein